MPESDTNTRQAATFTIHRPARGACQDARFDESLLELASAEGPVACLWQIPQSLVVPRTYRRFDTFDEASERFAALGWPITVRQTGGGIVPQGPGIVNVSLAYAVEGPPMRHSEAGYQLICQILSDALNGVGVAAVPAPVEGSFCDGRYNLAVERDGAMVKVAGTAQMWRKVQGSNRTHMGLVHALVLVNAPSAEITSVANAFERALGSGKQYRADRVTSMAEMLGEDDDLLPRFERAVQQRLAGMFEF